jgi:hypothetical protein
LYGWYVQKTREQIAELREERKADSISVAQNFTKEPVYCLQLALQRDRKRKTPEKGKNVVVEGERLCYDVGQARRLSGAS